MSKRSGRRRKMPDPFSSDPFDDDRGLSKRKLRQLCRQVERALVTALASDTGDDDLLHLSVVEVLPWPNASRLWVGLAPTGFEEDEWDRETLLEKLNAARGQLRTVVAGAIHRKRAPELSFEILPRSPGYLHQGRVRAKLLQ